MCFEKKKKIFFSSYYQNSKFFTHLSPSLFSRETGKSINHFFKSSINIFNKLLRHDRRKKEQRKKEKKKKKSKLTCNSILIFGASLSRTGFPIRQIPTTRKKKVFQSKPTFLFPITLRSSSHVLHPRLRFTDRHHRSVLLSSTTRERHHRSSSSSIRGESMDI